MHPSAIMVLTAKGKVSRYFAGIEYPPKDVRLALGEAAGRRIGSLTDFHGMMWRRYRRSVAQTKAG